MRLYCALPTITLLVLAHTLGTSTEAAAQDTPPIAVGERVRVSTASGATYVGLVGMVTSAVIEVQDEEGSRSSVPLSTVRRLEVSRGQKSNASAGAFIGFVTGAITGALIGGSLGDDPPLLSEAFFFSAGEKAGIGFLLGAGGGAIIGALIGEAVHSDRWVEVPLERLRVSLAPQRHGRFAFGFSVRF